MNGFEMPLSDNISQISTFDSNFFFDLDFASMGAFALFAE